MRLFFLFLLLPFAVPAQTGCRAEDQYPKWIAFERKREEGNPYIIKGINDSTGDYCYAALVKDRYLFFDYLFEWATAPDFNAQLLAIKDSTQVQKGAVALLRKDTLFNRTLNNLVAQTVAGTKPKDSLDFKDVLDVAVKFFNVNSLSKDGNYKVRVCVGYNGLKETMKRRNLLLEAFCFDAIMKRYQSQADDSLHNEFIANAQEMAGISLGEDRTAKLHRAQGALYLLMGRSELLRRTLREAYEAQKAVLPFVLRRPE